MSAKASVIYIFFKYCADVENCDASKGFDFIYIYIYIDENLLLKNLIFVLKKRIHNNVDFFIRVHFTHED